MPLPKLTKRRKTLYKWYTPCGVYVYEIRNAFDYIAYNHADEEYWWVALHRWYTTRSGRRYDCQGVRPEESKYLRDEVLIRVHHFATLEEATAACHKNYLYNTRWLTRTLLPLLRGDREAEALHAELMQGDTEVIGPLWDRLQELGREVDRDDYRVATANA